MKGLFITFEGIEGCGKTTQIQRLNDYLRGSGHTVEVTREPGGTPIAETIREVLLDPGNHALAPMTELLLYEAARAQHVAERIRPALESGAVVLCDRFADSTTAYQGAGRSLSPEDVQRLHQLATQGVWPDLTFLIDLPVETGLDRVSLRGTADRMESETLAFHERVRQGFLELARREPRRITIIDGTQTAEAVAEAIRIQVDAFLKRGR
jgi:dTMP kinase